jgi:hypothetical protein
MNEDSVAFGKGDDLDAGSETPPGVTLTTGWNLIGHYGLVNLNRPKALSSLTLGDQKWWNSLTDKDRNEVSEMEPTKAYWVSIIGVDMESENEVKYFKYLPAQTV